MRVTADTNFYISALNFGGKPAVLLRLAASGEIDLALSGALRDEIEEVLRKKFHWPPDRVQTAVATLSEITHPILPTVELDVVKEDPDDNRVLECALSSGSDFVISGDKHLLKLRQHDGIRIITLAEFLQLLQYGSEEK